MDLHPYTPEELLAAVAHHGVMDLAYRTRTVTPPALLGVTLPALITELVDRDECDRGGADLFMAVTS